MDLRDPVFSGSITASAQILRELNKESLSADQMNQRITMEPFLAAKIVAAANTAAYVRYGGAVNDVPSATTILGTRLVRTIVAAVVTRQLGESVSGNNQRTLSESIWSRCAYEAAAGAVLADKPRSAVTPEEALFAGIVRYFGMFYIIGKVDASAIPAAEQLWLERRSIDVGQLTSTILKALAAPELTRSAVDFANGQGEATSTGAKALGELLLQSAAWMDQTPSSGASTDAACIHLDDRRTEIERIAAVLST
jgi:hypothetical protein